MSNPAYVVEAQHLIRSRPGFAREIARQLNGKPMGGGMTARQSDLLRFIRQYIGETGYTPSYEEMKEALGLASKSGIHRLVCALEERGYITRLPNHARAIELRRVA